MRSPKNPNTNTLWQPKIIRELQQTKSANAELVNQENPSSQRECEGSKFTIRQAVLKQFL
jgi:hypothetical protein